MDFDISHLLEQWDYEPGKVAVRRFKGRDGKDKIQLRVDMGLLQMEAAGRPDGKRPFGYTSLFDYHKARRYQHLLRHRGSDEGFKLSATDCLKLQVEALQYHHRYICLLELEDYPGVVRDAERNLAVFDFAGTHAGSEELAWSLQQLQPQLLMILTRARGLQALTVNDHARAIELVEQGVDNIRAFYNEHSRPDLIVPSAELQSLEAWLSDLHAARPLSPRERLERALSEAVKREDYEKAALMRDALRNLKTSE